MKGSSSCSLVASVLAAALASSSVAGDPALTPCCCHKSHSEKTDQGMGELNSMTGEGKDKFAPRFDGLRFIETLVTAHR